jgi:hypothetical protein
MRRKGLTLLLATVLMAGSIFPLPECYLTKVNCPRKATGACPVFGGKCQSAEQVCGQVCPFSQANNKRLKSKTCYKLLQKLQFYPVRSLVSLSPENVSVITQLTDTHSNSGVSFQDTLFMSSVGTCERASPLFIQNQSFLI